MYIFISSLFFYIKTNMDVSLYFLPFNKSQYKQVKTCQKCEVWVGVSRWSLIEMPSTPSHPSIQASVMHHNLWLIWSIDVSDTACRYCHHKSAPSLEVKLPYDPVFSSVVSWMVCCWSVSWSVRYNFLKWREMNYRYFLFDVVFEQEPILFLLCVMYMYWYCTSRGLKL